jgi:hypothetical protein
MWNVNLLENGIALCVQNSGPAGDQRQSEGVNAQASSVFQTGILKLAQNYIAAMKIFARSSAFGSRRGCCQAFSW